MDTESDVSPELRARAEGLGLVREGGTHCAAWMLGGKALVWRRHPGAAADMPWCSDTNPGGLRPRHANESAALTAACDWLEAQGPTKAPAHTFLPSARCSRLDCGALADSPSAALPCPVSVKAAMEVDRVAPTGPGFAEPDHDMRMTQGPGSVGQPDDVADRLAKTELALSVLRDTRDDALRALEAAGIPTAGSITEGVREAVRQREEARAQAAALRNERDRLIAESNDEDNEAAAEIARLRDEAATLCDELIDAREGLAERDRAIVAMVLGRVTS